MKTEDTAGAGVFFLAAAFIVAGLGFGAISYNLGMREGYKQACKDCAEGRLKYELKELPGGERLWVKKQ